MKKYWTAVFDLVIQNPLPSIASIIFFVLLAIQLLVRPITGLADNGDFIRYLLPYGLYTLDDNPQNQYGNWVNLKYIYSPTSTYQNEYYSSERLFIFAAVQVNRLFSEDGFFDLRALGIIHLVFYWLVITIILFQARKFSTPGQLLFCAVILFFFSDVGYTQYLNSFYSEPMAVITFVAIVAVSLAVCLYPPPKKISGWISVLLLIFTALLVTSKPPFSLFGFLLIPWLMRVYLSITKSKNYFYASVMVVFVFCVSLFGFTSAVPQLVKVANTYNSIFLGVLQTSPDPYTDLTNLGFSKPEELVQYRGMAFWKPAVFEYFNNDVNFKKDIMRIGYDDILRFYFDHPDRLIQLADEISRFAYRMQVPYLGHYEIESGKPAEAMVDRFNSWSNFRQRTLPGNLISVLILTSINFLIALYFRFRVYSRSRLRYLPELHLMVLFGALSQFIATIFGEGTADVVKHLFFFNLGLDFCFIFLLFYGLLQIQAIENKSRSFQPGAH